FCSRGLGRCVHPAPRVDRFRQHGSARWVKPRTARSRLLRIEQMDGGRPGQRKRRRSRFRLREPASARQPALQGGPLLLTAWIVARGGKDDGGTVYTPAVAGRRWLGGMPREPRPARAVLLHQVVPGRG